MQPSSLGQIGPYRLLRELGRGAMGVVFLAQHQALGAQVAIKVLLSTHPDPELLARFRFEASVASKLDHPGIVRVQDMGQEGGRPYFVMEYCSGESLDTYLERRGPLPPPEATRLVAALARAAGYAHAQGVLHRDLKPANVILKHSDATPRITDFGLARDRSLQRSLTHTGELLGTPTYMAPEQMLGLKDLDARVDVYSLGVLLYQCLTGQRPYEAPSVYALVEAVCAGGCPSPAALTEVPPELERVCMRALSVEREDRQSDGTALALALEASLEPVASTRSPKRAPWVLLAAGLLTGIAVTGLGFAWISWQSAPAPPPPEQPSSFPPAVPLVPAVDPIAVAPHETVEAMERNLIQVFAGNGGQDGLRTFRDEVVTLRTDFPQDPRIRILDGLRRLDEKRADPLEEKRRWIEALERDPEPSDTLASLTARLCYELGFHRCASDALRKRTQRERPLDDWAVHTAVENHVLSAPPVQDPALAETLARSLFLRRKRSGPSPGSPWFPSQTTVLAYRAIARALKGENEQAAAELEADMPPGSGLADLATRLRTIKHVDPQIMIQVAFDFATLAAQLRHADNRFHPRRACTGLAQLADDFDRAGRPEHAALALLRGSRAALRIPDAQVRTTLLERAYALDLHEAPDVECLIARALGRAILPADPAYAERLARESVASWEHPELRTRGELADGYCLLAKALRARGNLAGARKALEAAAALDPPDTRELDRLLSR